MGILRAEVKQLVHTGDLQKWRMVLRRPQPGNGTSVLQSQGLCHANSLNDQGDRFSHTVPSERNPALLTPWFEPREAQVRLLMDGTVRLIHLRCVKPLNLWQFVSTVIEKNTPTSELVRGRTVFKPRPDFLPILKLSGGETLSREFSFWIKLAEQRPPEKRDYTWAMLPQDSQMPRGTLSVPRSLEPLGGWWSLRLNVFSNTKPNVPILWKLMEALGDESGLSQGNRLVAKPHWVDLASACQGPVVT